MMGIAAVALLISAESSDNGVSVADILGRLEEDGIGLL